MTSNKLVHYAIRLNRSLPPAVVSGEEPNHLSIYLPVPTHATTLSPTSSSSLFPLSIPPCLASPSGLSSEEGIIATDEWFYTPKGSPAPEVTLLSPTVAADTTGICLACGLPDSAYSLRILLTYISELPVPQPAFPRPG